MLKPDTGGYGMPKFHGETFVGGSKTAKLVNVSPSKVFRCTVYTHDIDVTD